jgi:hypothetical protein
LAGARAGRRRPRAPSTVTYDIVLFEAAN